MATEAENNKRIAKNTAFLYIRMLLLMLVSLFTSRIILQTLGVSDFGLNNVVAGIVTMFSFFNVTLSAGTQRFLNFELGRENYNELRKIFSTSLFLHLMLALIVLLLAETIGLWFICNKLVIPEGRYNAALWVYHNSILSSVLTILSLPYTACIIAHEKMNIYALMSIMDAVLKLGIVYVLYIVPADKLIVYSCLFLLVHVIDLVVYIAYCLKKYNISHVLPCIHKDKINEMLSFTSWNVIGSLAGACNGQGINILLNIFCGTTVNAARAVAYQVNNIIIQFSRNFQIAANPQIVKNYASGKKQEVERLIYNSSKFTGFLLLLLTVPFYVEIDTILKLWLGVYPELTPMFVRIVLLQSLFTAMTQPIIALVNASGYLKNVALTTGTMLMLVLPISYLLFYIGLSPTIVLAVNVIPYILEPFTELFWMRHFIGFPISNFYKQVYAKVLPIGIAIIFITIGCKHVFFIEHNFFRLLYVCTVSTISSLVIIYVFGLSPQMRSYFIQLVSNRLKLRR